MNKNKLIILIIAAIIISVSLFTKIGFFTKRKQAAQVLSVSVCPVKIQNYESIIDTYGTIIYKTKYDVTSLQSGLVVEKKIKNGDIVKKGQTLYILKNPELEIQHSQYINNLNSKIANISLYEAKLEEHKQNIKKQMVSIENNKLELQKLDTEISSAKEKLYLSNELNKLGGLSDQSIKDMEQELLKLETNRQILLQQLSVSQLGFTKEDLVNAGIEPATNIIDFEKQLIDYNSKTSIADLKVAKAEYENAINNLELTEKFLNDLIITSPVNGIVGETYFENGEHISNNEKVLTIIDINTCVASVPLQESEIITIEPGMETTITIPALNKTITSSISEISQFADSSSGTFLAKVHFSNSEINAKPGMFVKCSIPTNNFNNYFTLPETALINLETDKASCFSVKNNMAIKKNVKVKFIKDGIAFIESGVENKELIINHPSAQLKDGYNVKVL